MTSAARLSALILLFAPLAVGPWFITTASSQDEASGGATAAASPDATVEVVEMVGPFATKLDATIADRPATLKLTGTAFRKKFGIKFYQIAGYCCTKSSPKDVDALAALDVPKILILVLERDISENILRKSFELAFAANDPEKKFTAQADTFLNYVAAKPLKKGDKITITHLPGIGMQARVGDGEICRVEDREFAHVVWKVYMGPQGVCPVLREGLGERL